MEGRLPPPLLLLLLLAWGALVSGTPCPQEWRQRGATCYLANATSQLSWAGAVALCQENGGLLVSITNQSKLMDVVDVLRGQFSPEAPAEAVLVRRSGRTRRPPSRLVVSPDQSSYDSDALHISGPSAESEPGTAAPATTAAAGITQLDWWINIQKTSGSVLTNPGGAFDNYGEEKFDILADEINQCVYLGVDDGLWYWKPCHEKLNYICERPADRVDIELVTPDRRRPEPAWFAAHAARLEAAFAAKQQNASDTDSKGTFSPEKVTMTPIPPPSPTTPVPPSSPPPPPSPPGGSAAATTAVTTPCAGENWLPVGGRCHHLFLSANTWQGAQQFCQQQGGSLSYFGSQQQQDVFTQRYGYNTGQIWINVRRESLRWSHVTGYTAWGQGQPGGGDCAALALHTGKWSTADCSLNKPFACVRDVGVTAPPSTAAPSTTTSRPSSMPYPECGDGGWWRYGSSCLQLVSEHSTSWHQAQQLCRQRGAMLVKIDDYQKKAFLLSKLSQVSQVWIGLSKWRTEDGLFHWSDGSRQVQAFWAGNQNQSAEMSSCVRMDGTHGYWTSANCNLPQPYVCERPLTGSPAWPPAPSPPLRSTCPDQWRPYGADRCLKLFPQLASWRTARQKCRAEADGADLVTVPSAVHQAFLVTSLRESVHNVWLGLTYQKEGDQQFSTWLDEAPVNFTAWDAGQPTVPCVTCPETCGVIEAGSSSRPGAWSDVDCGNLFSFVCQRPATPNNTIEVRLNFCDAPFDEYTSSGEACYKVYHDEKTWREAAATCQQEGSSLAYVGDAFDNARLVELLYRDGRQLYWIGLGVGERSGAMEWTLPWPRDPKIQPWDPAPGQAPLHSSCAALQPHNGLWWHQACDVRRPFVCMHAPSRTAAALSGEGCPGGGGRWVGSEQRCYQLFQGPDDTRTWPHAKDRCESQGYTLAKISSMQEFLAVRESLRGLAEPYSAWIGLRSSDVTTGYTWTDGSTDSFNGWDRPEHETIGCVVASTAASGHWRSISQCSLAKPFICMAEKTPAVAVAGAVSGGGGGGAGWTVFGVICLLVVLAVVVVGGVVYARRHRPHWLPHWAAGGPYKHHSVDNLAYDRHSDSIAPNRVEAGSLENGDVDHHAAQRWGSQEQLVMNEDL